MEVGHVGSLNHLSAGAVNHPKSQFCMNRWYKWNILHAAESIPIGRERTLASGDRMLVIRGLLIPLANLILLLGGCTRPLPSLTMALAAEIARHTPEYVHFEPGARFAWVWVQLDAKAADSDLTKAVLSILRQRYVVYLSEEEIPAGKVRRDDHHPSYIDGFKFEFKVTHLNSSTVEIVYQDYEGPLASALQTIVYEWSGTDWVAKKRSPVLVS
jgi:hypothetical protein